MRRSLTALMLVAGLLAGCGGQATSAPPSSAPAAATSRPIATPTPRPSYRSPDVVGSFTRSGTGSETFVEVLGEQPYLVTLTVTGGFVACLVRLEGSAGPELMVRMDPGGSEVHSGSAVMQFTLESDPTLQRLQAIALLNLPEVQIHVGGECPAWEIRGVRTKLAPTATGEPLVTEPPVVLLSGQIEFGGSYNESTLEIIHPAARFKATSRAIAYVAHLRGTAGATKLTLTLTRRASGGAEMSVFSTVFEVANPDYDTLASSYNFALLADQKPGTYVLRIIRQGSVLAEGTFTLVK